MKVNMGQPNDLLLDDLELLLREIEEFNTATTNNKPIDIPQALENYLHFVAKSGNTVFPWTHVRNLFRSKMVSAIQQFQEPTCSNESFVLERFDLFRLAAPFTVQRLTELILQPTRHYRKKEKFLRGLEKTVLVVSTVEPRSLTGVDEKNGNDANNISASSGETEAANVTFNRTFSLDRQEIVTPQVRASLDMLGQEIPLASDTIVLDPVASAIDVVNQNIGITTDGLISEAVSAVAVSSVEVITQEGTLDVVSAETMDMDAVSIEADDESVSAMECESSNLGGDEVSTVNILQDVSDQDLVSSCIQQVDTEELSSPQKESVLKDVSGQNLAPTTCIQQVSGDELSSSPQKGVLQEVQTDQNVVPPYIQQVDNEELSSPVQESDLHEASDQRALPTSVQQVGSEEASSPEKERVLQDVPDQNLPPSCILQEGSEELSSPQKESILQDISVEDVVHTGIQQPGSEESNLPQKERVVTQDGSDQELVSTGTVQAALETEDLTSSKESVLQDVPCDDVKPSIQQASNEELSSPQKDSNLQEVASESDQELVSAAD